MTAWPEWKPIESAPRDGTEILIASHLCVEQGHWDAGISEWMDVECIGYVDPHWPTHWLPLPPLPTPPATGEAE